MARSRGSVSTPRAPCRCVRRLLGGGSRRVRRARRHSPHLGLRHPLPGGTTPLRSVSVRRHLPLPLGRTRAAGGHQPLPVPPGCARAGIHSHRLARAHQQSLHLHHLPALRPGGLRGGRARRRVGARTQGTVDARRPGGLSAAGEGGPPDRPLRGWYPRPVCVVAAAGGRDGLERTLRITRDPSPRAPGLPRPARPRDRVRRRLPGRARHRSRFPRRRCRLLRRGFRIEVLGALGDGGRAGPRDPDQVRADRRAAGAHPPPRAPPARGVRGGAGPLPSSLCRGGVRALGRPRHLCATLARVRGGVRRHRSRSAGADGAALPVRGARARGRGLGDAAQLRRRAGPLLDSRGGAAALADLPSMVRALDPALRGPAPKPRLDPAKRPRIRHVPGFGAVPGDRGVAEAPVDGSPPLASLLCPAGVGRAPSLPGA